MRQTSEDKVIALREYQGASAADKAALDAAGQRLHDLLPRVAQMAMNTSSRMFPDLSAVKAGKPGEKPPKQQLSPEALALQ